MRLINLHRLLNLLMALHSAVYLLLDISTIGTYASSQANLALLERYYIPPSVQFFFASGVFNTSLTEPACSFKFPVVFGVHLSAYAVMVGDFRGVL